MNAHRKTLAETLASAIGIVAIIMLLAYIQRDDYQQAQHDRAHFAQTFANK